MSLAKAIGGTSVWLSKPQEALGEYTAWTLGLRAEEAPDGHTQLNDPAETRQISETPVIAAMDAVRIRSTEGTSGGWRGRLKIDAQRVNFEDRIVEAAPGGSIKEFKRKQ